MTIAVDLGHKATKQTNKKSNGKMYLSRVNKLCIVSHFYTTQTLIRITIKISMGTEPTPLALDNFRCFPSNSTKFSEVIENAMGFSFSCKLLTR